MFKTLLNVSSQVSTLNTKTMPNINLCVKKHKKGKWFFNLVFKLGKENQSKQLLYMNIVRVFLPC